MNKRTQERKILAAGKVYGHSLPASLRHSSPACALEDAKAIAYLLSHMVDAFAAYQSEICEKGYSGMGLVLDLL
ncbi:hypothetical protein LJB81_04420, partial [Desulfovibrio sp. OttesenSCG-928-M14]|nr:hypothetical protein [Desulfovibrio sp. OttesenSCG-928-M14]